MFAAGGGHSETVLFLLQSQADVNVAVVAAAEYVEQVAKAVAEGVDEAEPHKDGVTALMLAAQGGHLAAAEMLVAAGADLLAVDDEDLSALLYAVQGNHSSVAKFLVESGADPNDQFVDDKGVARNLLMDSILAGNSELSLLLARKGANCSFADEDGVSVVTQAAYLGLEEVVAALLLAGGDANAANSEGINALIAAASEGHWLVVESLLAAKAADVNSRDKDGTNALMAAAVRGHREVAESLIKHGVRVNEQNVDGHTALMFAYNGKNQVETLLDRYSSYLGESGDSNTQLIKDALRTHVAVVDLLLKSGSDPSVKVKMNCSANFLLIGGAGQRRPRRLGLRPQQQPGGSRGRKGGARDGCGRRAVVDQSPPVSHLYSLTTFLKNQKHSDVI